MFVLIIFLSFFGCLCAETKNVCASFSDYYNDMTKNTKCYFNPDADLNVAEIVMRNGFSIKKYFVLTEDGYILSLFRILPRNKFRNMSFPVLLAHGMALNSVSFVDRGNKSLAFMLASAGFDVWLGNFRGSQYSKRHLYFQSDSKEFWNFSYHELGVYDLPAQLSFIGKVTGQRGNIIYIGFSMGTTAGFVYNAIYPKKSASDIRLFISLAPVAYVSNIKSVFKYIALFWEFLRDFSEEDIFQKDLLNRNKITIEILKQLCLPYPFQMKLCTLSTMILSGFDIEQLDPETLPITTIQHTDATSAKTLSHFIQGMKYDSFSQFSYGITKNLKVYGSPSPPAYNLSAIQVPVYLIFGNNDWLATEKDVFRLYTELPKSVKKHGVHKINWNYFTHSDFLTAKDVKLLLYDHLIEFLKKVLY